MCKGDVERELDVGGGELEGTRSVGDCGEYGGDPVAIDVLALGDQPARGDSQVPTEE